MNLYKISKLLVIVVCIIAIAFFFATVGMDVTETNNDYIVDYSIYLSYLAMIIAFISVFYFVIKNLISDKKELKSALISAGLFGAVILVAFIIADGTEVKLKESVISPMYSKVISTGLNTFYILAFISVAVLAWTGISKFKK